MTGDRPRVRSRCGEFPPPTLEVLPEAIAGNVRIARRRSRAPIMAVVKADGYGHGAGTVARAAVAAGATWLGTTDVAEAAALRAAGLEVPILAWLHPSGVDVAAAAAHRIDVALGSLDELDAVVRRAGTRGLRIHLNVDVGMAREGCPEDDWDGLFARALRAQGQGRLRVVGLMGHLPLADRADPAANASAVTGILRARDAMAAAGLGNPLTHLAATSGTLTDPATHGGLVRFGAGLVGVDPSGTTALHGAARLTAPVVHSAAAPAGTPVGYGGDHVTATATNLVVLPLGYADGIPRELGADAAVEIGGRWRRLVGRVSMDQIVVDTGTEAVPPGALATVFGLPGGPAPTIHDWARWAGTIPHTIVTGIGPRVRRTIA